MLKKWDTLDSPSLAGLDISYERKKPTQITGGGGCREGLDRGGGGWMQRGAWLQQRGIHCMCGWVGGGLYYWTY